MITREKAHNWIDELEQYALQNGRPEGTWHTYSEHVKNTAIVSEKIASALGLDSEKAYLMGLLHDIGKIEEGITHRFHGIIGYEMLKKYDKEIARAALLHMFPFNEVQAFTKKAFFFDREEDMNFVLNYISTTPQNDYDYIIQMADSLGDYRGINSLGYRTEEYYSRNQHINPKTIIDALEPRIKLKEFFDVKLKKNLYDIIDIKNPDDSFLEVLRNNAK